MKRKLFAILMSLTLVLTYIPAMAFADAGYSWEAYASNSTVYLEEDDYNYLEVEIDRYEYEGEFTYTWYDANNKVLSSTSYELQVTQTGDYRCVVTDDSNNSETVEFSVLPDLKRWEGTEIKDKITLGETKEVTIENSRDYVSFEFKPTETGLYAFTSYGDEDSYGRILLNGEVINDPNDDDDAGTESNFKIIFSGEAGKTYYLQAAMYGHETGSFSVELANGPAWTVKDKGYSINSGAVTVNAVVIGSNVPSNLQYQWYKEGYDDWEIMEGKTSASITVSEEGYFKCEVTDPADGYSETGYYDVYFDYLGVTINNVYYQRVSKNAADGAEATYNFIEYNGSFAFPASVKLADGKTYPLTTIVPWQVHVDDGIYLGKNCKTVTVPASVKTIGQYALGYYMNEADDYNWAKIPGFTILGTTGSAAQRYAAANGFAFRDPAAEAAAAKEKARQGTPDSKIAKVKIKKPAAKKNAVTVKWTKLNKKQLKKSKATKYEVWVSTSKSFPAGATTKEVFKSKSKSSATVKGLKKNTKYFVKVRAVRYAGGVKYVGKWSSVKSIKTKKK